MPKYVHPKCIPQNDHKKFKIVLHSLNKTVLVPLNSRVRYGMANLSDIPFFAF